MDQGRERYLFFIIDNIEHPDALDIFGGAGHVDFLPYLTNDAFIGSFVLYFPPGGIKNPAAVPLPFSPKKKEPEGPSPSIKNAAVASVS